jgi:putative redox protein
MITVTHAAGDRLRIEVRGHELFVDQPIGDGGQDSAPTPTEIFVAGLGACVAFYAERFLRRRRVSTEGLQVTCEYWWAEDPHRVGAISLAVQAPGLPAELQAAFERVIDHCTVHNSLRVPPQVEVRVVGAGLAVA